MKNPYSKLTQHSINSSVSRASSSSGSERAEVPSEPVDLLQKSFFPGRNELSSLTFNSSLSSNGLDPCKGLNLQKLLLEYSSFLKKSITDGIDLFANDNPLLVDKYPFCAPIRYFITWFNFNIHIEL